MIYDILGEVFNMKICFVTGGTGGHIYPALALADKMKELDSSTEILFIGNDDRIRYLPYCHIHSREKEGNDP